MKTESGDFVDNKFIGLRQDSNLRPHQHLFETMSSCQLWHLQPFGKRNQYVLSSPGNQNVPWYWQWTERILYTEKMIKCEEIGTKSKSEECTSDSLYSFFVQGSQHNLLLHYKFRITIFKITNSFCDVSEFLVTTTSSKNYKFCFFDP